MGAYLKPAWEKELKPATRRAKAAGESRRTRSTAQRPASTGPQKCTSAASRPAPTAATRARSTAPAASSSAKSATATARTSATPSKPPAPRSAGARPPPTPARRSSSSSPRTSTTARDEFAARIKAQTGKDGAEEVAQSVERLFAFAGWADKYDGAVHNPPIRAVAVAMVEPIGVLGIVAPPSRPLLGSIALLAPAHRDGQPGGAGPVRAVAALSITDLYQVIETSDVPDGVINIVTGESAALAKTLAEHDGVDALWVAGNAELSTVVEKASVGNLKQTWTSRGLYYDLADSDKFDGDYFLRRATQVKNIWVPYGA